MVWKYFDRMSKLPSKTFNTHLRIITLEQLLRTRPDYFFIGITPSRMSNNFHVVNAYRPRCHCMDYVAWAEYLKRTSCSWGRVLVSEVLSYSLLVMHVPARRCAHIYAYCAEDVTRQRGRTRARERQSEREREREREGYEIEKKSNERKQDSRFNLLIPLSAKL